MIVAEAEGHFAKEGIALQHVDLEPSAWTTSLVAERIDVLSNPVQAGLFNSMARGAKIQVVADRVHSEPGPCSFDAFAGPPGKARRVAESGLRGETLIFTRGGLMEYLAQSLLAREGLTPADVKINHMMPQMGYMTWDLDAIRYMTQPHLSIGLAAGRVDVVAPVETIVPGIQSQFIVFGPRMLGDHDLSVRFLRAYLRGIRSLREGKTDRNVEILSRATNFPPEVIRGTCWPPVHADGHVNVATVEGFLDWARKHDYLDRDIPASVWWNSTFVNEAFRTLDRETATESR